jgi:hypothetical protein
MCCRPGLSCAQQAPIYALQYILPHRRTSKRRVRIPGEEDPHDGGIDDAVSVDCNVAGHVQQITRARFTTFTDAQPQSTSMQFSKMPKGYLEVNLSNCATSLLPAEYILFDF